MTQRTFTFMKKLIVMFLFTSQSLIMLKAQHPMGLVIGDLNTPYAYTLNPALTRSNLSNRAYINWWGASMSLDNNFMNYNAPFRISAWINNDYPTDKVSTNGTLAFQQDWLPVDKSVKEWNLNYLNEVHGPSIFIPLDHFGGFGFGVKAVSGFSVDGVSADLGSILRYGMGQPSLGGINDLVGKTIAQSEFSINAEKYQEWFMSFAGYSETDVVNSWRWGFTAKFLLGMGMMHLGSDELNVTITDNQNVAINQLNATYYHTNDQSVASILSAPFGLKFDFVNGAGMGGDLGFMYEYRPNAKQNYSGVDFCAKEKFEQYKWKFGASITDLGFISYDGRGSEILSTVGNYTIDKDIVNALQYSQGMDRFDLVDQKLFDPLQANPVNTFLSYSPTALNVQFDNALNQHLHLGAYWTQSLKSRNTVGLRRASYFSVVPRWQDERIEVGMPITLANDYSKLNWGVYGRIGPVIIGSDNLVGLGQFIKNDHYTGASFYFGFRSKIGDCEKTYKERYDNNRPIDKQDSVPVIKKNAPKDTVFVQKIVKDTVFVNKNPNNNIPLEQLKIKEADLKKKEDALKLKELDIKAKEDAIKAKQLELDKVNNTANTANSDCNKTLAILKAELAKSKGDLEKSKLDLLTLENQCKTAKGDAQIKVSQLEGDLLKEKAKNLQLASELEKAKILSSTSNNCAKQTKQLDSLLKIEAKRNADLNVELAKAKSDYSTLKNKCDESDKKLAQLQAEISDLKGKTSVGNSCCDKLAKLEIDFGVEKEKNAILQAEVLKAKAANLNQTELLTKANADLKICEEKLKVANSKITIPEDCTPYKTKAAQLDAKVAELNKLVSTLQLQVATLTADKKICEEKLKTAASSNVGVSEDCTPYKTKVAQLDAKVLELNKTIAALNAQVSTLTADKKICEEKLKTATSATPSSSEDCTPYKLKVAELEKKNAELSAKNATISAQVSSLQNQLVQISAEKKAAEDKLKNITASEDCTPYKTKIAQLDVKIADLNKQLTAALAAQKICEEKLKTTSNIGVSEDCTPYKTKVTELEKKNADLTVKVADLTAKNTTLTAQVSNLQNQVVQISAEKKAVEDKLKLASTSGEDCTPYKTKIADLEKQLIAVKAELAKANETLDLCNKAKSELSIQAQKSVELESKISACTADKNKLQSDLNDAKSKIADLEAKLSASASTNNTDALQAQINQLKADLADKNAKISTLTNDLNSAKADLANYKSKFDECQEELNMLKGDQETLRKQIIRMDNEMGQMGEIIKNKDIEITKLKAQVSTLQSDLKKCNDALNPPTAPSGGN